MKFGGFESRSSFPGGPVLVRMSIESPRVKKAVAIVLSILLTSSYAAVGLF